MPSYPLPENEEGRVALLAEMRAPELLSHVALDELTALAAHICDAPMALITVIEKDRQFFLSRFGLDENLRETPRELSFCTHAILQPNLFVIKDTTADDRFCRHPFVTGAPNIRFYAGAPLTTTGGFKLGTLCVIDQVPRELTEHQQGALTVLSRHVVTQLELHRSDRLRREAEADLKVANASLEARVTERTEALEEARKRLEVAISASNIGLWEYDLATTNFAQSPEWRAQLGFCPLETPDTGDDWSKRIHPEDVERVLATLEASIHDPHGDFECELRIRHKDGSYRWMLSRARVHYGPDKKPARLLGCHIDLTDRRTMEESLRHSQEELRALYANLHTVREEELSRIARELHDELGSILTGLKFDVAWLERQLARSLSGELAAPLHQRLHEWNSRLDEAIGGVRQVCQDLRPALLELGLPVAMEWQVNEFANRTGLPCEVHLPERSRLDPTPATAVFRILQELLTNIARHAHSTKVRVEMREEPRGLVLQVEDDGRGMPDDAWARSDRFGLKGIRERVLAARGTVEFDSTPETGTRVTVRVPYE